MIEHKRNIHDGKETTAIGKIALNEAINVNYKKTKKLTNYNNWNYIYCYKAIEIISNCRACKNIEHFSIKRQWLLQENRCRKRVEKTETLALSNFTT